MSRLDHKRGLIEEHDRNFAYELADRLVEKPKLSVWMILIPIIFVFYMVQYQRYAKGRRDFIRNYLISPHRALHAVHAAAANGSKVDVDSICQAKELAEESLPHYRSLMETLVEYYTALLNAKGETYAELVVGGFANVEAYRSALARLDLAWSGLIRSIGAQSQKADGEILSATDRLEQFSKKMRQEEADFFFLKRG